MLEQINGQYQVTPKGKKEKRETILEIKNQIVYDDILPIRLGKNNSTRYIENKKYIPFLSRKDNLPSVLRDLRLTSPTHNICITSIAQSIIGKGLIVQNQDNPNEQFMTWMKSVNKQRHSLNKVVRFSCEGERTMGNQFIEIVRGEIAGQKFLHVYNHSMLYCRLNNPDNGEPDAVFVSRKFDNTGYTTLTDEITTIPLWSPNEIDQPNVWYKDSKGFEHTMLHFKNEFVGVDFYGMPASYPILENAILESKITKYNIANFENNMNVGGAWIFKSPMTEEEGAAHSQRIIAQYAGEDKTGRFIFIYSELGLEDVEFKPFNTQKEGSFIEYDRQNVQKIYQGHNWDSRLGGSNQETQMGAGSQQIRAIWDAKEASLLNPYRHELIDEVIYPIQQIYSDWFNAKEVADYEMGFENSMPYSYSADVKPEDILQFNEQRELLGQSADPAKEGQYLWEVKTNNFNVQGPPNNAQGTNNNG